MVLTLYGFTHSTNTQRVALVLKENNVSFEFVLIDLRKGEHKSPGYLAQQPFGVVPCIDDDGFKLFESRAICRYITAKYAPPTSTLIPTDLKANALFEQAVSIETSYFNTPASTILVEKIVKKRFLGKEPDEVVFQEAVKKLESAMDIYEAILGKQKYLGGDEVTLADLFHIPVGAVVESITPDTLKKRPNVARWWEALSTRPSWLAVKDGIKSSDTA